MMNSIDFAEFLKDFGARYPTIPVYREGEWCSLWKTIRNCLQDRPAIEAFIEAQNGLEMPPTAIPLDIWAAAEKLKEVLDASIQASSLLSSERFGSISHVFEAFSLLQECVIANGDKDARFKEALDKCRSEHWEKTMTTEFRLVVSVAALLNPSADLELLSKDDLNAARKRLGEEIINLATRGSDADNQESASNESGSDALEINRFMRIDREAIRLAHKDLDLSKWWWSNRLIYPNLYAVALKYLVIPASSATGERQFSKVKTREANRRKYFGTGSFRNLVYVSDNMEVIKDPENHA
jgi:hypothetical protein